MYNKLVIDVDLDGDNDVLAIGEYPGGYISGGYQFYWYENLDGNGRFSDYQYLSTFSDISISDWRALDFDNDGIEDIIFISPLKELFFMKGISSEERFVSPTFLTDVTLVAFDQNIIVDNITNDEFADLLFIKYVNGKHHLMVYYNYDNYIFNSLPIDLLEFGDVWKSVSVGNFDSDTLPEILAVQNDSLLIYHMPSYYNLGEPIFIDTLEQFMGKIKVGDINGDAQNDIMIKYENDFRCYENQNDGQNFVLHDDPIFEQFSGGEFLYDLMLSDIDSDGDLDIHFVKYFYSLGYSTMCWVENQTGFFENFAFHQINNFLDIIYPEDIILANFDEDPAYEYLGLDMYFEQYNDLYWIDDVNNLDVTSRKQIIEPFFADLRGFDLADMNNDGQIDVVTASNKNGLSIYLQEDEEVWSRLIITDSITRYYNVEVGDFDLDGDNDVVAGVHYNPSGNLILWENHGNNRFNIKQCIPFNTSYRPLKFEFVDMDSDGDLDIFFSASGTNLNQNFFAWVENENGFGDFGPIQVVKYTSENNFDFCVSDFTQNGYPDVFLSDGENLLFFESAFANGGNWVSELVSAEGEHKSLKDVDMDGDGDDDLLLVLWSNFSLYREVGWYENDVTFPLGEYHSLVQSVKEITDVLPLDDLEQDTSNIVVSANDSIFYFQYDVEQDLASELYRIGGDNMYKLITAGDIDSDGEDEIALVKDGYSNVENDIVWIDINPDVSSSFYDDTLFVCSEGAVSLDLYTLNVELIQWQMINQDEFVTLVDSLQFEGVDSSTLIISDIGLLDSVNYFRCIVSNQNNSLITDTLIVVKQDSESPVPLQYPLPVLQFECQSDSILIPQALDNCNGLVSATTNDPVFYDEAGEYLITWIYVDSSNNEFIQNQAVIVSNHIAPLPVVENLEVVHVNCCAQEPFLPIAMSYCGDTIWGETNTEFPICEQGEHQVEWVYIDENENTFIQFQTIIIDDDNPPVPIVDELSDLLVQCELLSFDVPVAIDNCSDTIFGIANLNPPLYAPDTLTLDWLYIDGAGNASTQSQNVFLVDTISPEFICNDFTRSISEIDSLYCVLGDELDIIAQDDCSLFSVSNDWNGSSSLFSECFSLGVYAINWEAVDYAGNETNCQSLITIDNNSRISSSSVSEISVFPNPFHDNLFIQSDFVKEFQLKVKSTQKVLVFEKNIYSGCGVVELSHLSKGLYFLEIIIDENKYVFEIVKQ
jgi:hypothetical protein